MGLAIQKIKEIEMPETHAICSPSSYDRWHKCPASAKINATAIQEPSYPATEGTVIHEVAETDLKELINAGLSLSAASKYLAKKNDIKKSIIYNLNL